MKKLFLITIFLSFSLNSNGQTPEEYTKRFFMDFTSNSDKAIDDIYKTNPNTKDMTDAINNMKEVANNYPNSIGKYYGYELITQEKMTNNFVLLTYLTRFERQPMRFTFIFYKPNDKWYLFSLNFSANLDQELEEAAKIIQTKN